MACTKSGSKSYQPLVGPLKRKVCAQPLQPQQYIHSYILSMSTWYLAIDASACGQCIETKLYTK